MSETGFLVFTVLGQLLAVGMLFFAWQKSGALQRYALLLSTMLLFASTVAWVASSGIEFGVVQSLLTLPVMAWLFILLNCQWGKPNKRIPWRHCAAISATNRPNHPWYGGWRHLQRFVVGIFVSGLASAALLTWLVSLLPWQHANRFITAILLFPVLWGSLAALYYASQKPSRIATVFGLVITAFSLRALL